jgi:hypothetical protein
MSPLLSLDPHMTVNGKPKSDTHKRKLGPGAASATTAGPFLKPISPTLHHWQCPDKRFLVGRIAFDFAVSFA